MCQEIFFFVFQISYLNKIFFFTKKGLDRPNGELERLGMKRKKVGQKKAVYQK